MQYRVIPAKNFQNKNLSYESFITRKFPDLQYQTCVGGKSPAQLSQVLIISNYTAHIRGATSILTETKVMAVNWQLVSENTTALYMWVKIPFSLYE